ncbi:hypothetical protein PLUTO_00530 [Luteibacter phage vB_LflM-Pluto]|uniref:Uncharacterized protein n=1 Tax=Luteibacter phage vB_LflM-Pluto TaxID=2948611 RepID=A0A9E7MUL4_9CAUD|nr:hypothetical protein PLUTO_00530 [Luteibacter phage vB_LflM-Pluto]
MARHITKKERARQARMAAVETISAKAASNIEAMQQAEDRLLADRAKKLIKQLEARNPDLYAQFKPKYDAMVAEHGEARANRIILNAPLLGDSDDGVPSYSRGVQHGRPLGPQTVQLGRAIQHALAMGATFRAPR